MYMHLHNFDAKKPPVIHGLDYYYPVDTEKGKEEETEEAEAEEEEEEEKKKRKEEEEKKNRIKGLAKANFSNMINNIADKIKEQKKVAPVVSASFTNIFDAFPI